MKSPYAIIASAVLFFPTAALAFAGSLMITLYATTAMGILLLAVLVSLRLKLFRHLYIMIVVELATLMLAVLGLIDVLKTYSTEFNKRPVLYITSLIF